MSRDCRFYFFTTAILLVLVFWAMSLSGAAPVSVEARRSKGFSEED